MIKLFSTSSKDAARAVVWVHKSKYQTFPRFGITRATETGGPVLRGDTSFGKINGFLFRVRNSVVFVTFRRFWLR